MKFGTLVADPPWKYTRKPTDPQRGRGACAEHKYPTMTTEEIAALPVAELAADVAHLYCWVTNPVLTEQRPDIRGRLNAMDVVRAWGFTPITILTWIKSENGAGPGWYWRGDTEHVIFAIRGNAPIPEHLRRSNVFRGKSGEHSQKPDTLMDMAELVSPGPRLELFSRRARFGWSTHGFDSLHELSVGGAG